MGKKKENQKDQESLLGSLGFKEEKKSCFPSLTFKQRIIGFCVCFSVGMNIEIRILFKIYFNFFRNYYSNYLLCKFFCWKKFGNICCALQPWKFNQCSRVKKKKIRMF